MALNRERVWFADAGVDEPVDWCPCYTHCFVQCRHFTFLSVVGSLRILVMIDDHSLLCSVVKDSAYRSCGVGEDSTWVGVVLFII